MGCLSAISDSPSHHYQLDHVVETLHRHHKAQSLGPSLCNWKSTSLRPLTGWNLSFEDIKSSILATGACDATKDPWSRKDRCFEHNEEEGETSVNPLMCSPNSSGFLKSHGCVIRMTAMVRQT